VALCAKHDRLFQIHVNDNYGDWDWDMLVGQVNFWTTLEFFYWLKLVEFDDFYIMDFFPYREDGRAALAQCVCNTWRFTAQVPLGRLAQPEDIAHLVAYLCSELGGFICGQCILVDGGRTLWRNRQYL